MAGALLPAAGMAGRQHPLCVAYHCKRRAMFGKLAGVVFGLKCLQLTGMYEYGKESKPLPVSVKSNVHMLKSNMCTCLGRAWQVWMVPGGGGRGAETLTITFNVVIQFELCFGCRCFPLSCQWPKCEGMAPQ